MSGVKTSSYGYDAERAERARLLPQVAEQHRAVQLVLQQIQRRLAQFAPELRERVGAVAGQSEGWLRRAEAASSTAGGQSLSTASGTIGASLRNLTSLAQEGAAVRDQLGQAVMAAEAWADGLLRRQAHAQAQLAARSALLAHELGTDVLDRLRQDAAQAASALSQQQFGAAEALLDTWEQALASASSQAGAAEGSKVRQQQVRDLLTLRRAGEETCLRLDQMLQRASPGLQATFAEATATARQQAEQWRQAVADCQAVSEASALDEVRDATDRLQRQAASAQQAAESLGEAYGATAATLRAAAQQAVAEAAALFANTRQSLEHWHGHELLEALAAELAALEQALATDRLREASALAAAWRHRVEPLASEAATLQTLHERRLYVLSGLLRLCSPDSLGFKVLADPDYEDPADHRSRLVLRVDTYNRGLVTFYLSLDSIEADAGIREDFCLSEFDRLSERLAEQYGVQTRFRRPDAAPPRLEARTAKHLGDQAARSAQKPR